MKIRHAPLAPLTDVSDLARLCARLAEPRSTRERILAEAGVAPAELEQARAKWSHLVLGDREVALLFRAAYAEEASMRPRCPAELRQEVRDEPPCLRFDPPGPCETSQIPRERSRASARRQPPR
jgi:hypothetical protein